MRARDAAPAGLHIIVGQEVRTSTGDLIALYIDKPIPPGMAPYEAAQAVRDQGGVVGLPHPFDRFRAGAGRKGWEGELERVIPLLDYVEAWNARLMVGDGNRRAADFAKLHGLAAVAASDAHTVMEVGVAYTILDGPLSSAEEFRAALASGPELVTSHGSRLIRLGMPFAKAIQRVRGNRRMSAA
jgi:predicted metal-dependent phosphoesterase TrpH